MKNIIYFISGVLFGWGLSLSGMIDPEKIKNFLTLGGANWNPALLFVLGSAVIVYFVLFLFIKKRRKTLDGKPFSCVTSRRIDKKLILGSMIFGIGWGLSGICPGPAIVHLAFPDIGFAIFILMMIVGFEIHRKINSF